MRSHRRRLLFASGLLIGALAAPAAASAGWTPPASLVEARAVGIDGAAARDGSAVLLIGIDGASVSVKMPGETFGPIQHLGPTSYPSVNENAKLIMSPDGRALVVWATAHHVHAAVRQPGARTFTGLGSIRVYPDDPSIDAVADVEGALGAGGQVYLGWSAVDTAHVAVRGPSDGGFTTIASARGPGDQPYAPGLVLAAAGDGDTVGMLTSGASTAGTALTLTRWRKGGSATTEVLESATTVDTSDRREFSGAGQLHALSGPTAEFIWATQSFKGDRRPGASGEFAEEFRHLRLPAAGPVDRPVLPIRFDNSTEHTGAELVRTIVDPSTGGGAIAIVPVRKTGDDDYPLFLSRRADAATPFSGLSTPFGTTRLATDYVSVAARGGGRFIAGFHSGDRPRFAEISADGVGGPLQDLPRDWPEQAVSAPLAVGAGNGDVLLVWYAEQRRTENFRYFVTYDDTTPPSLSAAPSRVTQDGAATEVEFSADASDRWTPATVTWDFGNGATASGPTARHRFSGSAPVQVTVTATDAGGNRVSLELRASSPGALRELIGKPSSSSSAATAAPTATTQAAPALSKLRLARTSFVATRGKVKGRRGTTVRFSLSTAATVELRVSRLVAGRRTGKTCVTGVKAKRTGRRCTARRVTGTTKVAGRAGTNAVPFNGKLGRQLLRTGRYELRLTPERDGVRGRAATARFTIAAR